MQSTFIVLLFLAYFEASSASVFHIPSNLPKNASAKLDPAPIGVSIEFFAFPEYIQNLSSTQTCLHNFKALTGVWPPMRIGGTTQDRATYNATFPGTVYYDVMNSTDAPLNLTYGPSFFSLAAAYDGDVIIGLNRRLDNRSNTVEAAERARSSVRNLEAIELGNEPSLYVPSDPIAKGSTWTARRDFASQTSWQRVVGKKLHASRIFSAGVYLEVNAFNNSGLLATEGSSLYYVKDVCSHNYPQSPSTANLSALMSHSAIASQIAQFRGEVEAARKYGKYHIMGETNSATGGGGGVSPTFGAALWLMDYSFQMLILGTKALYFHQGTIGACPYCWWGQTSIGSPYYGAYFATLALAGADHIAPLDDNTSNLAAYAIFSGAKPVRVLLYNSNIYESGPRNLEEFTLTGLVRKTISVKRLTAPSALSQQSTGETPLVAGESFSNLTCNLQGSRKLEHYEIQSGQVTLQVHDSEAILVYI